MPVDDVRQIGRRRRAIQREGAADGLGPQDPSSKLAHPGGFFQDRSPKRPAIGLTSYTVKPGRRVGFAHSHDAVEEVYLVVSGTGRFKLDDEIVEVKPSDVIFCQPQVVREWEAGDDGLKVIAFGSHAEGDGNMETDWWTD